MPGGGSITFSARNAQVGPRQSGKLAPGDYVCVAVTDSGQGMDEDTLRRAAEPFFTTKPTGKGTGLGLSIVHGLAQQQGGALLLRSTPGSGTTVEIWLPAVKAGTQPGVVDEVLAWGCGCWSWTMTLWCWPAPVPCWRTSAASTCAATRHERRCNRWRNRTST